MNNRKYTRKGQIKWLKALIYEFQNEERPELMEQARAFVEAARLLKDAIQGPVEPPLLVGLNNFSLEQQERYLASYKEAFDLAKAAFERMNREDSTKRTFNEDNDKVSPFDKLSLLCDYERMKEFGIKKDE